MPNVQPLTLNPTTTAIRPMWFAAPAMATIYPFTLQAFHSVSKVIVNDGSWEAWLAAAALLLVAIAIPLLSLACAVSLGREARPSAAHKLARRIALLAVAVPPMFTLSGVIFMLLGHADWDVPFLVALWIITAIAIALASRTPEQSASVNAGNGHWRTAHGIAAALAVLFLSLHFSNHMVGWIGAEAHAAVMKVLRTVYRSSFGEPILIGAFGFLILSGAFMAWRLTGRQTDGIRTFQIAGGVFLVFSITSHVNAVLYVARVVLGIDSDWGFGIGAPTGLLKDAWNIRLLPYYLLAVFFVISHAFCGLRLILMAHHVQRRYADRVLVAGIVIAAMVATLIMMAMCGLRIHLA